MLQGFRKNEVLDYTVNSCQKFEELDWIDLTRMVVELPAYID